MGQILDLDKKKIKKISKSAKLIGKEDFIKAFFTLSEVKTMIKKTGQYLRNREYCNEKPYRKFVR